MSDRIVRSVNETNEKDRQFVQSYESIWMSRWMGTTCNTTIQTHSNSNEVGNLELDYSAGKYNSLNEMKVSRSVDGRGKMKTTSFGILNESPSMSSEGLRNEGLEFQDFTMAGQANRGSCSLFKHGQYADHMQALRPVSGPNFDCEEAVDCRLGINFPSMLPRISAANVISSGVRRYPDEGTSKNSSEYMRTHSAANVISSGGCRYPDEGTSKNSSEYMRTHSAANDSIFASSKPLQESFVKTSWLAVPSSFENEKYEFEKGKMPVTSLIGKSAVISNHLLTDANLRNLEHGYHHNRSQSEDLVCEGDMDCQSLPESSVNALFKETHTSLLFHAPSTNSHHLSAFGRDWFQKIQKCSGIRMFPSQFIASEKAEFKKSLYDCYSRQKVPKCVCDVETMRIRSTVDSVVERGGCPRFSQTVHRLLITEKTDVNLSKENDISRGIRVLGNTPSDLHSPYPFHGQGKQGLKLQSLSSSCNSEGKENFEHVKSSKVTIENESLAEIDNININSFKEKNPQAGAYSYPSNEAISMDWNFPHGIAVASSSKQAGCRYPNTKLPDINLNLSALPTVVTFSENTGPMSSRTRSLEMDIPLAHAEHPKPLSNLSLDGSPVADPSNRQVKRLKLSSSPSSSQGTKISNLTEHPAHEKVNKFCSRNLNSSSTSSEPNAMKPCGKESITSDQSRYLSEEVKALLSHTWIKRWLHNRPQMTQNKSQKVMFYDPQHSTLAPEDPQKKQFPSVAAMAMMGKAIRRFERCQLQKRGTITVWNTKAF